MKEKKLLSEKEYNSAFAGDKRAKALKHAMDIRKFEIGLYWQRTAYFWAFIAIAFAGFTAIQSSSIQQKDEFSVLISCLGFVLSFAWFLANRGSKQWQENWENHVDLLEDDEHGPLYKMVLKRPPSAHLGQRILKFITGPSAHSVSKINQIISLYTALLWLCLIFYALPPFSKDEDIRWDYVVIVGISVVTGIVIYFGGKTHTGDHFPHATIRKTRITTKRKRD